MVPGGSGIAGAVACAGPADTMLIAIVRFTRYARRR